MKQKRILVGMDNTEKIRKQSGQTILRTGQGMAVEIYESLEGNVFLIVHKLWPKTAWYMSSSFTVEIDNGVALFPNNMPADLAADALNAAAGETLVRVRDLGATCPQCGASHGEWVETFVGLHCALCGWIVGTQPEGHVKVGEQFCIRDVGRGVVAHPRTRVKVIAAYNQVTGCVPDKRLWARPGELPNNTLELRQAARMLSGYEHVYVKVVELPKKWDLPRDKGKRS